jgi:hypothetical protein
MGVTLDDFQFRGEGGIVERIGKLAETAADRGNDASFAQFTTGNETAATSWAANLCPEAESLPCFHPHAVYCAQGETKIMNFASLEREFLRG